MYVKCCIPSCESTRQDVKLHKFPSCNVQRNKWLESINCVQLKQMDPSKLDKLLVCHKHFEARFHTKISGIRKTAYPTLFSSEEIETGVPTLKSDDKENVLCDHSYAKKRHYDHTYCKEGKPGLLHEVEPLRDLSSFNQREIAADFMEASTSSFCADQANFGTIPALKVTKKRRQKIVHKMANLSTEAKQLYEIYKKSRRMLNYKLRVKKAMDFSREHKFEELTKKMNPLAKKILWMQIKMCTKNKKGRRFSLDEKLIALSILKQGPKTYKFLQKFFILPSRTTLKKIISSLDVKPGLNPAIFMAIKEEVNNWDEKKKLCTIMFDEMSVNPELTYSQSDDSIHGFVELKTKSERLADHALVFMMRGAVCKWQQPIAFYFTAGTVSSQELQVILKDVISAVLDTGLVPIAIVCDQGSSFQSALNTLQHITRGAQIHAGVELDDTIEINGTKLSIIYDPPHLIKGIRNNFLTKNITCDGKLSTWQDIVDVYNTDCHHTQSRLLYRLNDEHVIPGKIKKMKVRNCVRVFSQTVAAALSYTSAFSHYTDGRPVSMTIKNTADTISFLDNLFDSVNGSTIDYKTCKGKSLRKAVMEKSAHHGFWREAIQKLDKIKFIDARGNAKSVPSLKNWKTSVKSFQRVWQVLKEKNIKIMRPRYFNSDPIENFFGRVRAYNYRNNDPSCHTFINTFKSLLVTSFISFHSESYNCEDDACSQLVKIKSLFNNIAKENTINTSAQNSQSNCNTIVENIQIQAARERLNIHSRAYVAGWVGKKILEKLDCNECKANLCTEADSSVHKWISHREYKTAQKKKLTYPSENLVRHVGFIIDETNEYLEYNSHRENISTEIKNRLISKYSFDFINCETHKDQVLEYFLRIVIKLFIHNWCRIINNILKGTDVSRLRSRVLPNMQKKALEKYLKKFKNK